MNPHDQGNLGSQGQSSPRGTADSGLETRKEWYTIPMTDASDRGFCVEWFEERALNNYGGWDNT